MPPITYPCCCGGPGPPPPIPTACCPGTNLPATIFATIDGGCAGQYALNWNSTLGIWVTYAPVGSCPGDSGKYSLGVGCNAFNQWQLFVQGDGCAGSVTTAICDPLLLFFECVTELDGNCNCGADNPCVPGTGANHPTVTITLLP